MMSSLTGYDWSLYARSLCGASPCSAAPRASLTHGQARGHTLQPSPSQQPPPQSPARTFVHTIITTTRQPSPSVPPCQPFTTTRPPRHRRASTARYSSPRIFSTKRRTSPTISPSWPRAACVAWAHRSSSRWGLTCYFPLASPLQRGHLLLPLASILFLPSPPAPAQVVHSGI